MSEDPIFLRSALNKVKRRNLVVASTAEELTAQIEMLKEIIRRQDEQIRKMIKAYEIKEKIIKDAVERANIKNNEYLEEIIKLKKELRECRST